MPAVKAPRIFNGKITIENASGEHRTFSIKTQKKDSKFAPGKRVIGLLSGPDNQSDYMGFGFVDDDGVHLWSKFKDKKQFIWFSELVNVLVGNLPNRYSKPHQLEGYRVHVSKKCLICNRELTTPESIQTGIGPICAEGY